jgi:hypothetical protein
MNKNLKIRVWEPLNKEFHYPKLGLYENVWSINKKLGFILPLEDQCLSSYTIMNLDAVEVELGIDLSTDKGNWVYYEGDIVLYNPDALNDIIGVVKFGNYAQDGSAGEYRSRVCYGFYIERLRTLPSEWDDPDDIWNEVIIKPFLLLNMILRRLEIFMKIQIS